MKRRLDAKDILSQSLIGLEILDVDLKAKKMIVFELDRNIAKLKSSSRQFRCRLNHVDQSLYEQDMANQIFQKEGKKVE